MDPTVEGSLPSDKIIAAINLGTNILSRLKHTKPQALTLITTIKTQSE